MASWALSRCVYAALAQTRTPQLTLGCRAASQGLMLLDSIDEYGNVIFDALAATKTYGKLASQSLLSGDHRIMVENIYTMGSGRQRLAIDKFVVEAGDGDNKCVSLLCGFVSGANR
jgi:hypothetical protein